MRPEPRLTSIFVGHAISPGFVKQGVSRLLQMADCLGQFRRSECEWGSAAGVPMLSQQGRSGPTSIDVVQELGIIAGCSHRSGADGLGKADTVSDQPEPVVGVDLLEVVQDAEHPSLPCWWAATNEEWRSNHAVQRRAHCRHSGHPNWADSIGGHNTGLLERVLLVIEGLGSYIRGLAGLVLRV